MTPSELRCQAERYRAVARTLPPEHKAYYLQRAAELESQDVEPAALCAAGSAKRCLHPQVESPAPPPLTLRKQTRIHSLLAVAVLGDKRPNIHRAFTLWLTLRQQNRAWFSKSEVIRFYAEKTGKHPRNVRRWLDSGDGVFWVFGRKNRLSILGKNRVFANYRLVKPGRVLLVDTDKLMGKLQGVKSTLYGCWLGGKNSKWASRATIRKITNVSESTQLNYDRQNKQKKQATYALDWRTESSENRQLPNRYQAVFYPAHSGKQSDKTRRYNLYSLDTNGVTSTQGDSLSAGVPISGTNVTGEPGRVLFDNPNRALAAARKRAKQGIEGQCFMVIGDSPKGNLILKTIDYGMRI